MAGNFQATSNLLPSKLNNAIGQPPLCDLIRVVGNAQVILFVQFELIKMSSLVSVGGNMNDAQIQFIATQLVEMFPNESLADFKICFQRGCIGQYGEIYRMDGIVIRKWMEQYLDEKYTVVEENLKSEKEDFKKQINPTQGRDWYKVWLDTINTNPVKKTAPMTDEDVLKEGREKPKKEAPYPITSPEEAYVKDRHLAYIEYAYEPRSGEKMPGVMSELDFNAEYDRLILNQKGL